MTNIQRELINRAANTIVQSRDGEIIQISRAAAEDVVKANPNLNTTEQVVHAVLIQAAVAA